MGRRSLEVGGEVWLKIYINRASSAQRRCLHPWECIRSFQERRSEKEQKRTEDEFWGATWRCWVEERQQQEGPGQRVHDGHSQGEGVGSVLCGPWQREHCSTCSIAAC